MKQTRAVTNGDTATPLRSAHDEAPCTLTFQLVGIASGSFTPQSNMDDTNWVTHAVFSVADPATKVTSITAAGIYRTDITGVDFRLLHVSPTGTNVITHDTVVG